MNGFGDAIAPVGLAPLRLLSNVPILGSLLGQIPGFNSLLGSSGSQATASAVPAPGDDGMSILLVGGLLALVLLT